MTLDTLSFVNLVNHFGPQLRRIMRGEQAGDVILERTTRRTLVKHGVLEKQRHQQENGAPRGTATAVTDKARRLLEWPDFMKLPPEYWLDKELNTWLDEVSIYTKREAK